MAREIVKAAEQVELFSWRLQHPHYTDYGPEENNWEHQVEYEEEQPKHAPRLRDLPDSAYHVDPDLSHSDNRSRHYNPWTRHYEPNEWDEREHELADEDEESGYNWGPPPEGY